MLSKGGKPQFFLQKVAYSLVKTPDVSLKSLVAADKSMRTTD
jgi:hypothetical protein